MNVSVMYLLLFVKEVLKMVLNIILAVSQANVPHVMC